MRLERPSLRREREFLEAALRSRALHRGFVTTASSPAQYRDYLRRARRANQESFLVIHTQTDELVGVININDIIRYSEQAGRLGYYAFVPLAGKGLMGEALAAVIRLAFQRFGLHRLEANIQPSNKRSIALIERLGFQKEGTARRFLKIGGRWRDHERWALLREDWLRR